MATVTATPICSGLVRSETGGATPLPPKDGFDVLVVELEEPVAAEVAAAESAAVCCEVCAETELTAVLVIRTRLRKDVLDVTNDVVEFPEAVYEMVDVISVVIEDTVKEVDVVCAISSAALTSAVANTAVAVVMENSVKMKIKRFSISMVDV